ncbi:MAG: WD40 repeat domain-containing protein [Pyrinomonadaceae bacterium]|nr:WD40 repeat domain-containing protein [Acidobacteriota bacterium]MBP7375371.1 WD40 repeat domain-containing protein [Pyrinomonadaceae bacterium]
MPKTKDNMIFTFRHIRVFFLVTCLVWVCSQTAYTQSRTCPPASLKLAGKAEKAKWNSIKDSRNEKDYQSYLTQFPKGRCAETARQQMASLKAPFPTKPPVSTNVPIGNVSLIQESLFNEKESVMTVRFSPVMNMIASGGWNNSLKHWRGTDNEQMYAANASVSGNLIFDLAFSPDGKSIVTGSRPDYSKPAPSVRVWNAADGTPGVALKNVPSELCGSVAYSRDGARVAAGCFNQDTAARSVRIWDAKTGAEIKIIKDVDGPVVFSKDGSRVTGGHGYTRMLKLFEISTGNEVFSINGQSFNGVESVAMSPDGKHLVSGNSNGSITIWDANTGKEITAIKGHTKMVNSVSYSPNGQIIASVSEDGSVAIWNAATGAELWTVKETKPAKSVSFNMDGSKVVIGGEDGIRVVRVQR